VHADETIRAHLERIYGADAQRAWSRLEPLLAGHPPPPKPFVPRFSEADAVLITYGDSLQRGAEAPLRTLGAFARRHLGKIFSAIHLLPFFPYSSDDGFAVTDFEAVDPALGDWEDIRALGADFHLMFDFVLNHISAQSAWFRNYLEGRPGFADLAIETDPGLDLSAVVRPRALPLLTEFRKADGRGVHLWTTFSADQVDLNYRSLEVLERMVSLLLFYVRQGMRYVRMDAVAYLWKEIGTDCIHRPQTHSLVQFFRSVLDRVAPDTQIITETNVPHPENVGYFGDGRNEAQMVYNFTLPPLLLHAFLGRDATALTHWARSLRSPGPATTFFNFTASHDGIGIRPLEGILRPETRDALVAAVLRRGGRISSRHQPNGKESPYELNITYLDALAPSGRRGTAAHAVRFLASQAIQYALPGVPATYIHSLLGSRNWSAGVRATGRPRSINRQKLSLEAVLAELEDARSLRAQIFHPYRRLIALRRRQPAFHPNAGCTALEISPRLFALRREAAHQTIWALTNISPRPLVLDRRRLDLPPGLLDLWTGATWKGGSLRLEGHQFMWLVDRPRKEDADPPALEAFPGRQGP
jgi:sucrose phosphorylase